MTDTDETRIQTAESPSTHSRIVAFAILGIVAAVALIVLATLIARGIGGDSGWDVEAGQPVEVTIAPGSNASTIYGVLEDAGVARAASLQGAARSLGVEDRLQAGTYSLLTDSDPDDVIELLVAGPNLSDENTITIVEGWTVDRIIQALADATPYTQAEYQLVLRNGTVTSPYLPASSSGIDELTRWEGLLYPATYQLHSDTTPTSLLGDMADEMTRRLNNANWSRIDALGVTRYEALVVASLVEREAGTDEERARIASVIYNRLAEPMRLQIDATVIYGLGFNPGRVLAEHLEVDSPYNTYRVDGLPPTPIGTVSAASLDAALDPEITTYLFYVLGGEDGSHLFAETYEGHQANIAAAKDAGVLP